MQSSPFLLRNTMFRSLVTATAARAPPRSALQSSNSIITRKYSSSSTLAKAVTTTTHNGDRVVVLGAGWAGFQLALNINKDVPFTVVSPRNHFLFTPLLVSTAVGTLEHRCIQEPVRTVLGPKGNYLQAEAKSLDVENKTIVCESVHHDTFELEYDKLVIAVGFRTNTFGIAGIEHNPDDGIFFIKDLAHARAIRTNIIDSFEKAAIPTVSEAEKKRLLSFLIVGGGPSSCEFVAELHDFVKFDVKRLYQDLLPYVKITLVEAGPTLLGPFDKALQDYALGLFKKRDVDVRLGTAVTGIEDYTPDEYHFPAKRALLSDGSTMEFGSMVWSAGLQPQPFTQSLDNAVIPRHERNKRILVDDYLRVKGHEGSIWAMGDAAVPEKGAPLPQLAQVARQQGIYLAKVFNGKLAEDEKPFKFFSLGSMAFLGDNKGIYDGSSAGPVRETGTDDDGSEVPKPPKMTGLAALLLWRFAYWGRQTSMVNKILIPMYWFKAWVFGRDVSRF